MLRWPMYFYGKNNEKIYEFTGESGSGSGAGKHLFGLESERNSFKRCCFSHVFQNAIKSYFSLVAILLKMGHVSDVSIWPAIGDNGGLYTTRAIRRKIYHVMTDWRKPTCVPKRHPLVDEESFGSIKEIVLRNFGVIFVCSLDTGRYEVRNRGWISFLFS
jgi:hypothetical protein